MPTTTTAVTACDVSVWLDDDVGVAQNVTGSSNSVDINLTQNVENYNVFEEAWAQVSACGKTGSFTLNAWYTTATDEAMDLLKLWYFSAASTTARTFSVYVPDKDVGSDRYQAEVIISDLSFSPARDEATPIAVSATLVPAEITHTTAAT